MTQEKIESPCIGVCALDDASVYCQGCYRTLDEIKGWDSMNQDSKKALLLKLNDRQSEVVNFD